jgi:hypothetical protein
MLSLSQQTIDSLVAYLEEVAENFKQELRKDGHYASGRTEKSIKVVATASGVAIKSNVAPKYLTEGATATKSKGSVSLYSIILEWVKVKNVTPSDLTDEQFARAITWKRHRQGYKVPNRFNDGGTVERAINIERIMKEVNELIGKTIAVYVESEIIKNFK